MKAAIDMIMHKLNLHYENQFFSFFSLFSSKTKTKINLQIHVMKAKKHRDTIC